MAAKGIGFESFSKTEEDVFLSLFGRSSDSEDESSARERSQILKVDVDDEHMLAADSAAHTVQCSESTYTSSIDIDLGARCCVPSSIDVVLVERKQLGIAHQLWPAAKFLCEYFHKNPSVLTNSASITDTVPELTVIELGAGIGLCGMFVAKMLRGSHRVSAYVTDLPEAIEGLHDNIERNSLTDLVKVRVLSWGVKSELDTVLSEIGDQKPLIIAADCVYWECLFEPLFHTLRDCITLGCKVIIAHVRRWKKDGKFFAMCRKAGFTVTTLVEVVEVVPHEHTGVPTRQVTRIYCIEGTAGREQGHNNNQKKGGGRQNSRHCSDGGGDGCDVDQS